MKAEPINLELWDRWLTEHPTLLTPAQVKALFMFIRATCFYRDTPKLKYWLESMRNKQLSSEKTDEMIAFVNEMKRYRKRLIDKKEGIPGCFRIGQPWKFQYVLWMDHVTATEKSTERWVATTAEKPEFIRMTVSLMLEPTGSHQVKLLCDRKCRAEFTIVSGNHTERYEKTLESGMNKWESQWHFPKRQQIHWWMSQLKPLKA
jgi:hypothetical protein